MLAATVIYRNCGRTLTRLFCYAALLGTSVTSASADRIQGTMGVVWADPKPGVTGGGEFFTLTTDGGTKRRLLIEPAQQGLATYFFGRRVLIEGTAMTDSLGRSEIGVQRIEGLSSATKVRPPAKTRRVLYLLLKFADVTQEPHSPTFYLALTNPKAPNTALGIPATLNSFFLKTSWGNLRWRADTTGWLSLPYRRRHYVPCTSGTCADLGAIANDGIALAVAAGVDLSSYDNINFVLNDALDCCAYGGGWYYKGKSYGATWEPPWGQETGTWAHEFGHSIGLPHSGWVYFAYDSPWDVMSDRTAASWLSCDGYSCSEPGDGYIAAHKDYLGWIPAANEVVIGRPRVKKIALEANAWPLGTAIKMIKICLAGEDCSGAHAHYLTVESRVGGRRYENGLPGGGVLIQDFRQDRAAISGPCFWNSESGWVLPIDATPGDYDSTDCTWNGDYPYALFNAQFLPGQIYSDSFLHVSVEVLRKTNSGYLVRVTRTQ
jgi:hypothetical protein